MIQVVVLAPSLAARAGLGAILAADPQVEVVAQASTLQELETLPPFDVLVTTAEAYARREMAAFAQGLEPAPALLLLSDDPDTAKTLAQLPLRAWGLLPEDCSEDELVYAVQALHQGLMVSTPAAIQPLLGRVNIADSGDLVIEELTERETEVLELLAEGMANKQIAYQLGISEHTIKFHVSSIYTKLAVSNRTEAVRRGIRLGLISL